MSAAGNIFHGIGRDIIEEISSTPTLLVWGPVGIHLDTPPILFEDGKVTMLPIKTVPAEPRNLYEAAIRFLWETEQEKMNKKDQNTRTPPSYAIENGHFGRSNQQDIPVPSPAADHHPPSSAPRPQARYRETEHRVAGILDVKLEHSRFGGNQPFTSIISNQ